MPDTGESSDPRARAAAAERLLAEAGIGGTRVRAAGRVGEIAAVEAPPGCVARVRELAPRIRALGFRYVALDLEACAESG